jgi:5'-nucleotidase
MIRPMHASLLACGFVLAAVVAGCNGGDGNNDPFTVKIIAFNDFHGNLQSPGTFGQSLSVPAAERPPVGGAEFMASYVARLKAQNPNHVVVGAGDLINASPLVSALFYDEPAVEALNRIGLEFSSVGNHEFDRGATELLRLQRGGCKLTAGATDPNSCKGATAGTPVPFEGAKFKWLSANVIEKSTGKPLLAAYGVKSFNEIPVAFIGMTLKETPTIVTPSGVAGLDFRDEADTVNALVPELRAQGIEAMVVLIHQGGFQSGAVQDVSTCDGGLAGSDIARIVARLNEAIDLVVSAHTHAAYVCRLPNASGRLVTVTSASAFGRLLTDIDVTINPSFRDIVAVTATNRLVSRSDPTITPNAFLAAMVNNYNALVSPIANQVIGSITTTLSSAAVDNACNMPAGNLIADAQLAATAPAGFGDAVIAFMNRGGVRAPLNFTSSPAGEGDGNVTYGEAFTTQPFGNSLVTMTLTARDVKEVLEQQFAGCRGQGAANTRIMIPSAGFKYTFDGAQACDARVRSVTLRTASGVETLVDAAGALPNPTRTYRVTVNSFMATGGDGFTTFLKGTNLVGGAQDIDALVAHMAGFKAPKPPYAPGSDPRDAGTARIQRIGGTPGAGACPGGANTNP